MKTITMLRRVILMFFAFTLILSIYDWMAAIAAKASDENKTCENNLFTGRAQPANAVNYFIVRFIAGFSASLTALYLFWRPRPKDGQTGKSSFMAKKKYSILNNKQSVGTQRESDAEKLIA